MLHLACHASIARTARRTAHLSLHGGDLAAEELTEAVGGAGGGRLGLVLLAACRSHVSGRGHNEAYSLATAFLVAGARSVVGSLWPVPDDATSVLMFLTHHFLRTENEPPARALRRAQLWMLDPGRELPQACPPASPNGPGASTPTTSAPGPASPTSASEPVSPGGHGQRRRYDRPHGERPRRPADGRTAAGHGPHLAPPVRGLGTVEPQYAVRPCLALPRAYLLVRLPRPQLEGRRAQLPPPRSV